MSRSRFQFTLSRYHQPPEEFRRNIRAMSRELRKTTWRPKHKPGQYVLLTDGAEGQIIKLSPGIPPGYTVVMFTSRYHSRGTHVFVPESMIKAHRRSPPVHASTTRHRK